MCAMLSSIIYYQHVTTAFVVIAFDFFYTYEFETHAYGMVAHIDKILILNTKTTNSSFFSVLSF